MGHGDLAGLEARLDQKPIRASQEAGIDQRGAEGHVNRHGGDRDKTLGPERREATQFVAR